MLRITTLMDNEASEHKALINNHGLSLHVEYGKNKYLFDCGSNEEFMNNAYRLGVSLDDIDAVVISHNHYDHGSGYLNYVDTKKYAKRLYTGLGFFDRKYATSDGLKYCALSSGLTEKYIGDLEVRHEFCGEYLKIDEGVHLMSSFESQKDFECIPERFVKETKDGFVKDFFKDETSMIFESEKGLIVLVGCSHPGIASILLKISEHFKEKIYAVFGGTHLVEADDDRILKTEEICKNIGVEILGLSHCSGLKAEKIIQDLGNIKTCHLCVGDTFVIS